MQKPRVNSRVVWVWIQNGWNLGYVRSLETFVLNYDVICDTMRAHIRVYAVRDTNEKKKDVRLPKHSKS